MITQTTDCLHVRLLPEPFIRATRFCYYFS